MKFLLLYGFLFSAISSTAQHTGASIFRKIFPKKDTVLYQNIRGLVLDRETHQPLAGASIVQDSLQFRGTNTDEHGNFTLKQLPVGRHNLRISYVGYSSSIVSVLLSSSRETVLEIPLGASPLYLNEVDVHAVTESEPIGGNLIRTDELSRHAGNRGEAIRRVAIMPGIQSADDSRNDIVIRGNSPQSVLWQVEGVNIPNPNHFNFPGTSGGPVTIINDRMLANSAFYSGAFPAQFGNTTSGIFDLTFNTGDSTKNTTAFQFGLLGAEISSEGPLSSRKRSSYIAVFRTSTIGSFHGLNFDIGTEFVPRYNDLAFKLSFPARNGATLTLFGLGGLSDIDIVISKQDVPSFLYGEKDRDQYFSTDMGTFGVRYETPVGSDDYLSLTLGASGQFISSYHEFAFPLDVRAQLVSLSGGNNPAAVPPVQWYDFSERRLSASVLYAKPLKGAAYLQAGLSGDIYFLSYRDSARNVTVEPADTMFGTWRRRWWSSTTALMLQPYIQYKYTGNRIDLVTGIHSQVFTLCNCFSWVEPRVSVQYHQNDRTRFNAGVGLHSQMNQPNLYFYGSANDDLGNPILHNRDMKFTRSIHSVAGIEKLITVDSSTFRLKMEAYFQYLYDIPVEPVPSAFSLINTGADFRRIYPETTLVNEGVGYNYGLELTLEKAFSRGYLFLITGSLFESRYKGSDNVLRDTDFNGNYILNALFTREWPLKRQNVFSMGTRFTSAGGRTYGLFDEEESLLKRDVVYVKGTENTLRFSPYHRFDVKVNYRINRNKTSHEFAADIINIFDIRNALRPTYVPGIETGGVVQREYQLGRLPFFYYRLEF
jgi:hypothetical protein